MSDMTHGVGGSNGTQLTTGGLTTEQGGSGTAISPTGLPTILPNIALFPPLTAQLSNAASGFCFALDEVGATLYATLTHQPAAGQTVPAPIAGATLRLAMRLIGTSSLITMSGTPVILNTGMAEVAYTFQAADITALMAASAIGSSIENPIGSSTIWRAAFLATFSDGQVREFGHLTVTITTANS